MMRRIITRLILVVEASLLVAVTRFPLPAAHAEEAGTGHYLPGGTASFIDMLPDRESFTLLYVNFFTYYHGSVSPSKDLELGGLVSANVKGTVYADTPVFLLQTPWKLFGGQYAGGIAVPYFWMAVQANVLLSGRRGRIRIARQARGTANGFSDVQMFPLMLGWMFGDLKLQTNFSVYAPTGGFEKGSLANLGKNYWTFEPAIAASYLSSRIGVELTGFAGFDFNTENGVTNYQTGDQFHLDVTAAQHLPLFGGFIGAGVNGFYYQQISGDSGSGARLGGFEGMTAGVGPVVSYIYSIGTLDIAAEAKWLPEIDVENRLSGNIVWFKLGFSYASRPTNALEGM